MTTCGAACHFELGTHFLDLGGLLFELGCESPYHFLLQLDHCFQLINFVIEHGLVLGARGALGHRGGLGRARQVAVRHVSQVRHEKVR